MHISLEVFRWGIAVKATLTGINAMLGLGCLQHLQSHTSDDVSTPVIDKPLVIVITSHILKSL